MLKTNVLNYSLIEGLSFNETHTPEVKIEMIKAHISEVVVSFQTNSETGLLKHKMDLYGGKPFIVFSNNGFGVYIILNLTSQVSNVIFLDIEGTENFPITKYYTNEEILSAANSFNNDLFDVEVILGSKNNLEVLKTLLETKYTIFKSKGMKEIFRRKYLIKSYHNNRMIYLDTPSKVSTKLREYLKPHSTETPRVYCWYDATDKLVDLFNDLENDFDFTKLSERDRLKLNHEFYG